ncbi:hypothetical protein D3C85_1775800 [compost metagenome]
MSFSALRAAEQHPKRPAGEVLLHLPMQFLGELLINAHGLARSAGLVQEAQQCRAKIGDLVPPLLR